MITEFIPDPFEAIVFVLALLTAHAIYGIALGVYRGLRDAWRYHHRKETVA